MADPINDGGPAFPIENPRQLENGELFKQFPGMTLRDWFAGRALTGMTASPDFYGDSWDKIAAHAYDAADAMIVARGKEGA